VVGLVTKTAFHVVLLTPRAKLLDCRAGSVVIPGSDGLWGVLRNHCPFLSGLSRGIMQVRGIADRPDAFYILEGGFVRFSENQLTVLAYEVVTFEGLDSEKVKQMVSHAKSVVVGQEYIKTQLQRTDVARSRLVVRMAEMASLLTPES
jgi:F-type H+-transporting ATPase subunit epsilon